MAKQNSDISERELPATFGDVERRVSDALAQRPLVVVTALVALVGLVLSPLAVFGWDRVQGTQWSETVKNVIQSGAIVAAALAVVKWVNERHDRATDVLLKLDDAFSKEELQPGRDLIEDDDLPPRLQDAQQQALDRLLRFYVVLYGVLMANQVPPRSLSICFRFWLAHYYRKDRVIFKAYVDANYPTLSRWLQLDCAQGNRFFGPQRLFGSQVDDEFIQQCRALQQK